MSQPRPMPQPPHPNGYSPDNGHHQHGYVPNPHHHGGVMPYPPVKNCSFPAPPNRSVYCEPAAYQQVNGQRYQKIVYAYGASRPINAMG